ncbi:hypothetical protein GCM10022403_030200 [Streptomyces coacervatus]|uniref:ESX-1 secretion-associated protein n=1 Tax=Streptomyces coacervatus TaxID=647381 RepID=A0ABP7HJ58_9ACTN|nr:hypothetical protein [Streptomyces coacervatus]MDF2271486.1 hypothetical protein [Streptomyces coacervatus]
MGDGFHADPDALLKYAAHAEQHLDDIPRVASALAHITVPAGAFGKLPDSDELHSAYQEHAGAAEHNVQDLVSVLADVAKGLRDVGGEYLRNEYDLGQGLDGIGGSIGV